MLGCAIESSSLVTLGDFYRQPDDITRGLTMYSCEDLTDFTKLVKADCVSYGFSEEDCQTAWGYDAEPIPEHNFFQLGPTTVLVSSVSAATLLDRLLDFLAEDASGVLLKVNRKKFTLKAQVFIDGFSCVAKAYIYKKCAGQYVIDIQRRSGDSVAFQRMYRSVSQHFELDGLRNGVSMGPSPVLQAVPGDEADCLQQVFQDLRVEQVCY